MRCEKPQGRGYGRILIEAGCDRARQLQHSRIALLSDPDDGNIEGDGGLANATLGISHGQNHDFFILSKRNLL